MSDHSEAFIGLDTSKLRHAVAIAEGGRGGVQQEVTSRQLPDIS